MPPDVPHYIKNLQYTLRFGKKDLDYKGQEMVRIIDGKEVTS